MLKVEPEKIFSLKSWIKDWFGGADAFPRFLLALFFFLVLNFSLAFRDIRIDVPSVGSVSKRFIINQTDFVFNDKQGVQLLKQQAQFNISPIYRLDERTLYAHCQAIQNRLVSDTAWRQDIGSDYQEVFAIVELIRSEAKKARLTDMRTLEKIKEFGGEPEIYFFTTTQGILPVDFWRQLAEKIGINTEKKGLGFALSQIENKQFIVYSDGVMEHRYREIVAAQIQPIATHFQAGNVILAPGDLVTERHIDIIHAMRDAMQDHVSIWNIHNFLANCLVSFLVTMLGVMYLKTYYHAVFSSVNKLSLLVTTLVLSLAFGKAIEFCLLNTTIAWREAIRYPAIYTFPCILITLLLGRTIAVFSLLFLIVLSWCFFSFDPERFALMNLVGALTAIFVCKRIHRRRQIFTCCVKVWVAIIPLLAAYHLIDQDTTLMVFIQDILGDLAFLAVTSLFTILTLPLIERIFHIMTDMTLNEYLDPNHPLLRRLSVESPGTYQHSLVVGHLAESAARSIDANDLFCRVATLYHDVGKLYHPQYFTENQMGGFNIHQLLTPKESAHVIIAHVPEGETIAKKYRLPNRVIDVIREHHGTTLVYYFYSKEMEFHKEDQTKVDPTEFRYIGPKPRSKESAIIMVADCVEAASRSLESPTQHALEAMVDKIVREKEFDGQFDDCQLTFEELGKIRKSMVKALMITTHIRVKYPPKELAEELTLNV